MSGRSFLMHQAHIFSGLGQSHVFDYFGAILTAPVVMNYPNVGEGATELKHSIKTSKPIADPRLKSLNHRKILLTIEENLTANTIQKLQLQKDEKTTSAPTEAQILAVLTFFKERWDMIASTDLTYTQCPDYPLTQQCETLAREYAPHVKAFIQSKCLALAKQSASNIADLSDLKDLTKFENKKAQEKIIADCLELAKQYLPTIIDIDDIYPTTINDLDDLLNLTVHRFNLMMPTVSFTAKTTINGTVLDEKDSADCQLKNIVLSDNNDAYIDVALALNFYDEAVSNLTAKKLAESKQNVLLHTVPSDSSGNRKPLSETEQQRVIYHSKWATDYYKTCSELARIKQQSTHSLQTAIDTLILRLRQAGVSNTRGPDSKLKFGGKGGGTHDYPGPDAKEGIDDFNAFLKPLHPSVIKKIFALKTRGDVSGAENFGFWWNQLLTGDKCVETTASALQNILGAQTILPSLTPPTAETKDGAASEDEKSYISELEARKTTSKKAFETALTSKEYKLHINNARNQELYKKIALQCHKHKITVKTIDELYSILFFIADDQCKLEFLQSTTNLKQLVQSKEELEAIKELFSQEFRTQGRLAKLEDTFNNDRNWLIQSDITAFLLALEVSLTSEKPVDPMKLVTQVGIQRIIAMLKQAANNDDDGDLFNLSLAQLLNLLNTPENCANILNEISIEWLLTIFDKPVTFNEVRKLLLCLMTKSKDKYFEILEKINPKILSKIAYNDIFLLKTLECLPENKRYDFLIRPGMKDPIQTANIQVKNFIKNICLPRFTDEQRYTFLNQYIPPNNSESLFIRRMLPTIKELYEYKLPDAKKADFITKVLTWDDWAKYQLSGNLVSVDDKNLADNLAYLNLQTLIKLYNSSSIRPSQAIAVALTQIAASKIAETKESQPTDLSIKNLMQFYQATKLINDELKDVIIRLTPETRGKLYDAFILDLKLKSQSEPAKDWLIYNKDYVGFLSLSVKVGVPSTHYIEMKRISVNSNIDLLFKILHSLPSSQEHRIPFLERLDVESLKKLIHASEEKHISNWVSLIKELMTHTKDKFITLFPHIPPEILSAIIAVPGVLDQLLALLPKDQQAKIELCRSMSVTERSENHGHNAEVRRFLA